MATTWLDPNFSFRNPITVDHTKVGGSSDLTDYPMLVSLTDNALKNVNSGGNVQNANGYDIAFSASNGTTPLDHEIEKYNASTGELVAWVRIPTLSHTVDTTIYMYYGNAGITTSQNSATVWDNNYTGVWHMSETSGTNIHDSTANLGDGTKVNGTHPAPLGAGKVGGGQSFDKSADGVTVGVGANDTYADHTIEAWVRLPDFNDGGTSPRLLSNAMNGNESYQLITCGCGGGGGAIAFAVRHNGIMYYVTTPVMATNTWYRVVATFDANTLTPTATANLATSTTAADSGWADPGAGLTFGMRSDGLGYWGGDVSEVRISNSVRSPGWITTAYNNENSPGSFFALGSQSSVGESSTVTINMGVSAMLTFTVTGRATACNSQSAATFQTGTTATALTLGDLSAATINGAAQNLSVTTNAANGFVVYLRASGSTPDVLHSSTATIADVTGTHASPSNSLSAGTAGFGYTTNDASIAFGANKWAKITTTPEPVLAASAGTHTKNGCVGYQATITSLTAAGSYATGATYTAVPLF